MKIKQMIDELTHIYEQKGNIEVYCEGIDDNGHIGDYPFSISWEVSRVVLWPITDEDETEEIPISEIENGIGGDSLEW